MLALVLAAALAAEPAVRADDRANDTATVGVVTAIVAAGLAALVPLSDQPQPGASATPMILGSVAFGIVAAMRPPVFFSGQPIREKPTTLNNVLRIIGSLTAVTGLGFFIAAFALRPNSPETSGYVMGAAAGLEALSMMSFSVDAKLGLPD